MQPVTILEIEERLRELPADKLAVVYDFVSYLRDRAKFTALREPLSESYQTAFASEAILRRDWDRPEEDTAWASLL
ncbi:MAG: hypothetical protein HY868_13510 [Chloroflexi bacterium]|nr:hypothetical protein [Chloroflexota bacterium]